MKLFTRTLRCLCSTFKPRTQGSTFQSKHYVPKVSVEEFLNRHSINYKITQTGFRLRECPFCQKPHNNDSTNLYKLNVHRETGMFFCFRCSSKGSWMDFRGKLLGISDGVSSMAGGEQGDTQSSATESPQESFTEVEYYLFYQNLKKEEYKDIMGYLTEERGLTPEVIEKYKLGAGIQKFMDDTNEFIEVKVVYFPMYRLFSEKERKIHEKELHDYIAIRYGDTPKTEEIHQFESNRINSAYACLSKTKVRGVGAENKKFMRQFPTGNRPGMFGLNLLNPTVKEIVITEGEYDAMAVYQETGIPTLSLPMGANSLPDNVLQYLDSIEKIYLWMDNDQVGQMNAPKIASKLGINRCFIVENPNPKLKDANDVLRQDKSLIKVLLSRAKTIPGKSILNFESIAEKVRRRILNLGETGVKSSELPFFNKKVKGLRKSQLTILSGGTGTGKTTLLSQLSLDFAKKKVATMWGSFEIQNEVLVSSMLSQFSNSNLNKHPERIDENFAKFRELPLYYMSFFGSTDVDRVFDTMQYAIEKYGISHIVIDTLQFLLSDQAVGFEKFDLQDRVMSRLRKITTQHDVHVTVVIHPRKTDEGEDLGLHSIFGSSKSVQEADNVWLIQQREGYKIFEVKKNRFDGDLGRVALGFNRTSKKFFELTQKELEQLFRKAWSVDDIVERRLAEKADEQTREMEEIILGQKGVESQDYLQRQRKRPTSNPYQR